MGFELIVKSIVSRARVIMTHQVHLWLKAVTILAAHISSEKLRAFYKYQFLSETVGGIYQLLIRNTLILEHYMLSFLLNMFSK